MRGPAIILSSTRNDGFAFLRNSYPRTFTDHMDRKWYHVEGFVQGFKAMVMGEREIFEKIQREPDAEKAKELGNSIRLNAEKWTDKVAIAVMKAGHAYKFTNNPDLKAKFLGTAFRPIVEVSDDVLWGTGLSIKSTKQTPVVNWPGVNQLGSILMQLRSILLVFRETSGDEIDAFGSHFKCFMKYEWDDIAEFHDKDTSAEDSVNEPAEHGSNVKGDGEIQASNEVNEDVHIGNWSEGTLGLEESDSDDEHGGFML
ncbi:hypothetical protein BGAL_0544g00070 [Botrytis galanthina]|uniref:NADAR domain-containing protein n=1 Tax=Botrytis galanthina TaxID=278940 RepID=A0A4V6T6U1_9HELO|nr:hypothetical protein BGAL_0544g00070 [Botrytis galanthina]